MKSGKRSALHLEALEDRWVPATVRFDGSNLYISNLNITAGASKLTVTETGANTFTVTDSGNNGSFLVTGNISITGNNAHDTIAVNLSANGLLGNLNVSTGSGQSTVSVDGNAGVAGSLLGSTGITMGTGGGTVNMGFTNGLSDRGNVNVTAAGTANNTLNVGTLARPSTFYGQQLVFSNFNNTTLGFGSADSFRGSVYVSYPNNGNAGTNTLGTTASILGNYYVTGGYGGSTVNVNGAAVQGTLSVNVKGAADSLTFGSGAATTVGSLSYTSANGNTAFTAGGGGTSVTVNNSVQFNWGNGANSFGSTASLTVNGSMNVYDGNGGLDVQTNTFQGSVLSGLRVNAGNGADSFTLDTTATTAAGGQGTGAFSYTGGTGGNTVTLNNDGTVTPTVMNILFNGGNANLVTLNDSGNDTNGQFSGSITWPPNTAYNPGVNAFNPNTYVFTGYITLNNVPS